MSYAKLYKRVQGLRSRVGLLVGEVPGPVRNVGGVFLADINAARISFAEPLSPGAKPVIGYRVGRDGFDSLGSGPVAHTIGTGSNIHEFPNLVLGSTYNLTVAAVNAYGAGPESTVTVVTSLEGLVPPAPLLTVTGA